MHVHIQHGNILVSVDNSDLHTCNTTTTTTTTTREPQIATKVYFKSWFSGKHRDYWTY